MTSPLLTEFERDCAAAGVEPQNALRAAGVHASLWWKWKAGTVGPSLRNFELARQGLEKCKAANASLRRELAR